MSTRTRLHMAVGIILVVSICMLVSAGPAWASRQALVDIVYKTQSDIGPTTTIIRSGMSVIVTVGTSTPTPSVMWHADVVSGTTSETDPPYPTYYPTTVMGTFRNQAAIVAKSHPGAADPSGSTVPRPTVTTKCFASIPPAAPGPPHFPGSCLPRTRGSMMRMPGDKRFGGTARMLVKQRLDLGPSYGAVFSYWGTPGITATPTFIGNYGIAGSGTIPGGLVPSGRTIQFQITMAPLTTGRVTVAGGGYGHTLSASGSHGLSAVNLTGMITMIRPSLVQGYARAGGTFLGVNTFFPDPRIETVSITFLPERS